MNPRVIVLAATVAAVTTGLAPAFAAPKTRTMKKSYTVNAPIPSPFPVQPGVDGRTSCEMSEEGVSEHREVLKTPAAGSLVVELKNFSGDWDIVLFGDKEQILAEGSGTVTPNIEGATKDKAVLKVKKAMTIYIDTCNYAGGATADASYVFTYKK